MAEITMAIITTSMPPPISLLPLDIKTTDCNCQEVKSDFKPKPVSPKLCKEKPVKDIESRKKELLHGITPHESLLSIVRESISGEDLSDATLVDEPPETIKGIVKDILEDIDEARYLSNTEINTPTSCVSDGDLESENAMSEDQNDDEEDGKEEEEQEDDERKKDVANRLIEKNF